MNPSRYQTAVLDYLAENYGIKTEIKHGTNHDFLSFDYDESPHQIRLHRNIQSKIGTATLQMKLQDIRRVLGPPRPKREERSQRKLEDMMPEPFNTIPIPLEKLVVKEQPHGIVSYYECNGTLTFVIPNVVAELLDRTAKYKVQRIGNSMWSLTIGGTCAIRLKTGDKNWTITPSAKKYNLVTNLPFFHGCKALYEVKNGVLIVTLLEDPVPHIAKLKKNVLTVRTGEIRNVAGIQIGTLDTSSAPSPKDLRSAIRKRGAAILEEVRRFEEETDYALTRIKTTPADPGHWEFRAPSIKL